MDFRAERVDQLHCSKCAEKLDPKKYKPMASIECPKCGTGMQVPAVFEKFLITQPIGSGNSGIERAKVRLVLTSNSSRRAAALSEIGFMVISLTSGRLVGHAGGANDVH